MKNLYTLFICLASCLAVPGQTPVIDSMKNLVNHRTGGVNVYIKLVDSLSNLIEMDSALHYGLMGIYYLPKKYDSAYMDTATVRLYCYLGGSYQFYKPDSAILLSNEGLDLARRLHFRRGEGMVSTTLGENYRLHGDYAQALGSLLNGLQISREIKDMEIETFSLGFIGVVYKELKDYKRAIGYLMQSISNPVMPGDMSFYYFTISNIGDAYEKLEMPDSAIYYQDQAFRFTQNKKFESSPLASQVYGSLGQIYARQGNPTKAIAFYHRAVRNNDLLNLAISQCLLANLYDSLRRSDSALYYARLGFANSRRSLQNAWALNASKLLVRLYTARKMTDSAFRYQSIELSLRDSIYSPQKFNKLQLAAMNDLQNKNDLLQKQKEAERQQENRANRDRIYGLLAALAAFLWIAISLYSNNRQKQNANALLNRQKNEISHALTQLKSTQAQLIQSEKMASLGELTAGIAHEIQNPLNFVNNFSEVNSELSDELITAARTGNLNEIQSLANDIKTNQDKIREHGLRADAIVKSMLFHSRIGSGQMEMTDINALCDEYLRLAFQGMRAKEKSFNADLKTDFDPSIGKVQVIPQDLGRVLLNLYNNAFYAIDQKSKSNSNGYSPIISVTTKRKDRIIEISVEDNGTGIPDKIKEKIFQPFFTTKPAGQGTGLGLSLSYDIAKAHGGEIRADSTIGEGSTFILVLPI
jgi:signal transduction histidine kinase